MNERRSSALVLLAAGAVGAWLRLRLFSFETLDYHRGLKPWFDKLVAYGGFRGVAHFAEFSEYPAPYMSLLGVLAELRAPPLAGIKLLSCVFDVALAAGVYACVQFVTRQRMQAALAAAAVFLAPTVVTNSAMWAQCDSIYAAFMVWSLYFLLRERFAWGVLFCGAALAMKLQAVLALVPFLTLLFARKLKWSTALLLPVPMVLFSLPAVLVGARWSDALWRTYLWQAGAFDRYSVNAPSVYVFVPALPWVPAIRDVCAVGAVAVAVVVAFIASRREVSPPRLVWLFFVSGLLLPFLLPTMHDRYFYLADVFGLVFAFTWRRGLWLAVLTMFGSMNAYCEYLFHVPLFDMRLAAALMLVALVGALALGFRDVPGTAPPVVDD